MRESSEHVYNKMRKLERGDLNGRVARATTVSPIDLQKYPNNATVEVYIQPDEPSTTTTGALWFDTDEPNGSTGSDSFFESFESYPVGAQPPYGSLDYAFTSESPVTVTNDKAFSGSKSAKSEGLAGLLLPLGPNRGSEYSLSSWMYFNEELEESANTPDMVLSHGNLSEFYGKDPGPEDTVWYFGAIIGYRNDATPRCYFVGISGEEEIIHLQTTPGHTGWHRYSISMRNVNYPPMGSTGMIRADVDVEIFHETVGSVISYNGSQVVVGGQAVGADPFPIVIEPNTYLMNYIHGSVRAWDLSATSNNPVYLDDIGIGGEPGRLRIQVDSTKPTEAQRWPFFSPKGLENGGTGRGKIYVGPPVGWVTT